MMLKEISDADLKKIIHDHELWRKTNGEKGKRADLSYTNLRGKQFVWGSLAQANLSHSDLSYADFGYADLKEADFSYSKLSHAKFDRASLSAVNFNGSFIDFVCFSLNPISNDIYFDDIQISMFLYCLSNIVRNNPYISEKIKEIFLQQDIFNLACAFNPIKYLAKRWEP